MACGGHTDGSLASGDVRGPAWLGCLLPNATVGPAPLTLRRFAIYNKARSRTKSPRTRGCFFRKTRLVAGKDMLGMGVSFGRSRIADLTFRVFNRGLHPDWFATRVFRRVEQLGWEADLRIIDGGHARVSGAGSIRLTEILSGPETRASRRGLAISFTPAPRTIDDLPSGWDDRIPELPRGRAGRSRDFPASLRRIPTGSSRDRLFHHFRSSNRLALNRSARYTSRRGKRSVDPIISHLSR